MFPELVISYDGARYDKIYNRNDGSCILKDANTVGIGAY